MLWKIKFAEKEHICWDTERDGKGGSYHLVFFYFITILICVGQRKEVRWVLIVVHEFLFVIKEVWVLLPNGLVLCKTIMHYDIF